MRQLPAGELVAHVDHEAAEDHRPGERPALRGDEVQRGWRGSDDPAEVLINTEQPPM